MSSNRSSCRYHTQTPRILGVEGNPRLPQILDQVENCTALSRRGKWHEELKPSFAPLSRVDFTCPNYAGRQCMVGAFLRNDCHNLSRSQSDSRLNSEAELGHVKSVCLVFGCTIGRICKEENGHSDLSSFTSSGFGIETWRHAGQGYSIACTESSDLTKFIIKLRVIEGIEAR